MMAAYTGYAKVAKARQETLDNLEMRNNLLQSSHTIRAGLLETYKYLDLFLLEPRSQTARQQVDQTMDQTLQDTNTLLANPWTEQLGISDSVQRLRALLQQLDAEILKLVETRLETTSQYPSMAIGNIVMRPNRNQILSELSLTMLELEEENVITEHPDVYQGFITLNTIWTQMLSNFRIYLANRMGSFNEEILPEQERGIETQYLGLTQQLELLRTMDEEGRLGFQASTAVTEIADHAELWFLGFQQVKEIHRSGKWRLDSIIIKETIAPLVDEISSLLQTLDNEIALHASQDMHSLSNAAFGHNYVLLIAAGFGFGFVLLILLSTEQLVFKPIATIAQALKAEAFGKTVDLLPMVHSKETQDLIDAFGEMRKQVHNRQADLEYQTLHDALTGLPNRVLLQISLEQMLKSAQRKNQPLSLFILDLNRFKEINDTLGHNTGDHILKEVGQRLLRCLRKDDLVARLGGDEFAILLPESNEQQAIVVANNITAAIAEVFTFEELQLYTGISIGIAIYPLHGLEASTLIQRADVAMYVAKDAQQPYSVYDERNDEYTTHRLALITDLRDALENNSLTLHYQPKLDLKSGRIISAEALLRWKHSSFGDIPPTQIITLAEQTGMITDVTYQVLENAIAQCAQWIVNGLEINVAVNLSVHILRDAGFTAKVSDLLHRYTLPAKQLTLEITESAMMANPVRVVDIVNELNIIGVVLSIDDFGTGFSSLSYLKRFDVDELKIDKSFVQELTSNDSDRVIVHSTIELAHNLGLYVIAEGVEDAETQLLLEQLGCDAIQGYYLGRPMTEPNLVKFITRYDASRRRLA